MDLSFFVRWEDDHGVDHWVTSQRGNRTFTACMCRVPPESATNLPPSRLVCIVEAEVDIRGYRR